MNIDELYKKYNTDMYKANHRRTICEVLREIHDITQLLGEEDLRNELIARIYIAYNMAKKMNKKLRENASDWDSGFWEVNTDWGSDEQRRKAKR